MLTKFELMVVVVIVLLVVGGSFGSWVFMSSMEARAFNSVTGKNVTTWEAMWIELRVIDQSK